MLYGLGGPWAVQRFPFPLSVLLSLNVISQNLHRQRARSANAQQRRSAVELQLGPSDRRCTLSCIWESKSSRSIRHARPRTTTTNLELMPTADIKKGLRNDLQHWKFSCVKSASTAGHTIALCQSAAARHSSYTIQAVQLQALYRCRYPT